MLALGHKPSEKLLHCVLSIVRLAAFGPRKRTQSGPVAAVERGGVMERSGRACGGVHASIEDAAHDGRRRVNIKRNLSACAVLFRG
jgi:hypothetical protein